jgi:DNA-directed RNA polymerase subunit K/omega
VYSNEDDSEGAGDDGDGEDDEDPDENYLQKFNAEINKNYITDFHPECIISNYDEVATLAVVVRDATGMIVDDLHRTLPYLTKYERARILGQRAKQINAGAPAFVKVPEKVIDGYLIAEMELANKTIPFIIRRPLPNGGSEYWRVNDLENIGF